MSVKLIPENVVLSNQTMEESPTYPISISYQEGIEFLNTLPDNSVDLIKNFNHISHISSSLI